jgi:hypothetical protein
MDIHRKFRLSLKLIKYLCIAVFILFLLVVQLMQPDA